MRTNRTSIRTALGVSTALLLAPAAAMAAELTYIETELLEMGDKVFRPDAIAFNANGQSVTCAEVAFHVARTQPACFVELTEEDIRQIRLLGGEGGNFTTMSGLSFAAGREGVVGLTEDGQSFAVAGATAAAGDTAVDMTDADLASFIGLDSAAQLGGAQAGIGAGATASTGGGVSVEADAGTATGDTSMTVDSAADVGSGGVSASVDADSDAGTGGVSVGVSGNATAGSGGVSVDADVDADTGGTGGSGGGDAGGDSSDGSAGSDSGGGGVGGGVGGIL